MDEKPVPVEYHLLSGRELYDATILTADRHHSSAGQWVLWPRRSGFYSVAVMTHPTYALPQALCLAFDCHSRTAKVGNMTSTGPPIDEIAFDFAVLLSVLARHAITPLGPRRIDNRPVMWSRTNDVPQARLRDSPPPACPINGDELVAILEGLGQYASEETVNAAMSAAKFYYSALLSARFDPSGAYVSLVSALECLAGHQYRNKMFSFADVGKFERLRPYLATLRQLPGGDELASQLEDELLRAEYFLIQKFVLLVTDFLPGCFWSVPDELYPQESTTRDLINRDELSKRLKAAYNARSKHVHAGKPFPAYVAFGIADRVPVDVVMSTLGQGSRKQVPPFLWFERLTQQVILEFLRRSFAPQFVTKRETAVRERERLLTVIGELSRRTQQSLHKLVEWTRQFLGCAIINPYAPNRAWAIDVADIVALRDAGIIGVSECTMEGRSWLRNREVGESVGQFFFGSANPFRGNELLLPVGMEDDALRGDEDGT